jgi:hypothetical protein
MHLMTHAHIIRWLLENGWWRVNVVHIFGKLNAGILDISTLRRHESETAVSRQ